MIKDIFNGVKEVVVELSTGLAETCQSIFGNANELFEGIEVKLMGSYEEIEAYEKSKVTEK